MYDAIEDPYCYPGTTVLKNRAGHLTQRALTQFETAMSAQRADEPLPIGRLSVHHYQAVHRHLFQDVYPWAGTFRNVRISRDGSMFCYPEHIRSQMRTLFGRLRREHYFRDLTPDEFVRKATTFLATLNAIHPFHDGNGRTQLAFMALLAARTGHSLLLDRLHAQRFLNAMVKSFHGDQRSLQIELRKLVD
jgi:cell filamentation protein